MTTLRFSLAGLLVALSTPAVADTPNEWLDRMSNVVSTIDFEGTVISRRNGESEALKVVRKIVDGVVQEKIVTQEGNGLEIIRNGNEVHCILPDKKSVMIEFWDDESTLFSTLPSSEIRFGSQYDLSLVREERVAGRRAIVLAVRPHDGYRYGHRIWLDHETAFPLRTELVGGDGALLEQLKFADIRFNSEILNGDLKPSFDLDGFTWYPEPIASNAVPVESEWVSDDLPPGFRVTSSTAETLPGSQTPVTHILFSDGLANVSVFIAEKGEEAAPEQNLVGGTSHSHSVQTDDHVITAIGEVPAATVWRIAVSIRRR